MWSGPEAATSLSVPPRTGLLADPPVELSLLDELLQAASPAAARLAIAMTAIRWERRVMSRLLLAWHRSTGVSVVTFREYTDCPGAVYPATGSGREHLCNRNHPVTIEITL